MKKKTVVVAMSGGVDSSVAAYLLKEQGYNVIGVTMQIWQDTKESSEKGCCSLTAVDDARYVANKLDIPFYVMNFKEVFKEKVIDYFVEEYDKGKTPNPCIACNREIKFSEFLKKALSLGADYIATGHYAKIEKEGNRYILKKSNEQDKDQTYTLYNLTQDQLRHTLLPLGEYSSKEEIRKIAAKMDLGVSTKPDSQEICFVPDNDYGKFIRENSHIKNIRGNFVNKNGEKIGIHEGIRNYTIGQRKGLGLALGYPAYVIRIDPIKNEVVVGKDRDVYGTDLIATDINLIAIDRIDKELELKAKIRYSAVEEEARITPLENGDILVKFKKEVRAITSGQSIVFYYGDTVIGGGTIK